MPVAPIAPRPVTPQTVAALSAPASAPITTTSAGFVAHDPQATLRRLLEGTPPTTQETFDLIEDEEYATIATAIGQAEQPGTVPPPEVLEAYLRVRLRNRQMVDRATAGQQNAALRQQIHTYVIQQSIAHLLATPEQPITRDDVARWINEAKQSASRQGAQDREAALERDGFPQPVAHAMIDGLAVQMETNRWSSAQADAWLAAHSTPLRDLQRRLDDADFLVLWNAAPSLSFPERIALLTIAARLHSGMTTANLQALLEQYRPEAPNGALAAQLWEPVIRRVWQAACGEWEALPDPASLPPLFDAALAQRPFAAFVQADAEALAHQALAAWRSARFAQWVDPASDDTSAEETEDAADVAPPAQPEQAAQWHGLAKQYRAGGEARVSVLHALQREFPQLAAEDIVAVAERLSNYIAIKPAEFIPIVRDRLQHISDAVAGVESHINTLSKRLKKNQKEVFRERVYHDVVTRFLKDPLHVTVQLRHRHYHLIWLYQVYIPYMDELDQEAVTNAPNDASGIESRYGDGTYAGVAAFFHEKYPTLHATAVSRHITECYAGIERTLQQEGLTTFVRAVDRRIQSALNSTKQRKSKNRTVKQWTLPDVPATMAPPARQATPVVATQLLQATPIVRFLADVASGWFDGPQRGSGGGHVEYGTIGQIEPGADGAHLVAIVNRGRHAIHLLCQRGVPPSALTDLATHLNDTLQRAFPNLASGLTDSGVSVLETGAAVRNHIRTVVWEELAARMRHSGLPGTNAIDAVIAAEVRFMQELLAIADAQIRKANPILLSLAKQKADKALPLAGLPVAKSKKPPFVVEWRMGRPYGWLAGFYDPSFRGALRVDEVRDYCRAEIEGLTLVHHRPLADRRPRSVFSPHRPTMVFGTDLDDVRATLRRRMPLFGRE